MLCASRPALSEFYFSYLLVLQCSFSLCDFPETSVGWGVAGDSMCAISIRDLVRFPVCADNAQVSSIHDFHGDNTSAATNRDINGLLVDKDREIQTTHLG